jgi:hypothetical protein
MILPTGAARCDVPPTGPAREQAKPAPGAPATGHPGDVRSSASQGSKDSTTKTRRHEDTKNTKNTKKGLMRFALCLNGHTRGAPKIPASSCSSCLRGGILSFLGLLDRCNVRPKTGGVANAAQCRPAPPGPDPQKIHLHNATEYGPAGEPHQPVAISGNPADAMLQRRAEALWHRNARVARAAHARGNARLPRREPGIEPRAATMGFDQQVAAGACSLTKHLGQLV